MKRVIFYFLVLLFAVWLGVTMYHHPGYVLIAYHNISIETSLWFAVTALIFLFIFFYALLRFSSGVGAITSYIRQWISNHKKRRAHAQTILGLYELVEGRWDRAEKKLVRSAKYSDMPLINYLAAAFTAQNQHESKRRDNYLRLAQNVAQENPIALGLAEVALRIGNKQWEEASAILQRLHQLQPKNVLILKLLHQAYLELKDWQNLVKLLPLLRKRQTLTLNEINQLEQKVYQELLVMGLQNHSISSVWSSLPRYLQKHPAAAAIYTEYLLSNNQVENAEAILKMILRKVLDEHLLEIYAILPSSQPIKQLMRAEKWLQNNPENAPLLLCLGRLCKKQKLWGKARLYLEKSVRLMPNMVAYAELAQITAEQNDLRGALDFYVKGLHTMTRK